MREHFAHSWTFTAIGVPWSIDTPDRLTDTVRQEITDTIDTFDRVYSRFRDDSLVAALSRGSGRWRFPDDAAGLMALYRTLYRLTDGRMSPLVGLRLAELGYGPAMPERANSGPTRWDEAMTWSGAQVETRCRIGLDVGAAGKGLLVDHIRAVLERAGLESFTVDGSGDIAHRDAQQLSVALEHPFDARRAIGLAQLGNAALCASATNRRTWGDGFHHVIDAVSGMPVETVVATWVIAADTMVADALATALFFTSARTLLAEFAFEYVCLYSDGRAEYSTSWPGEIFT